MQLRIALKFKVVSLRPYDELFRVRNAIGTLSERYRNSFLLRFLFVILRLEWRCPEPLVMQRYDQTLRRFFA